MPVGRQRPREDCILEPRFRSSEARRVRRREAAQVELRERIGDDSQSLTLRTAGKHAADRGQVLSKPAPRQYRTQKTRPLGARA